MNIETLLDIKPNPKIPDISPGDTVKVFVKVIEGGKERLQPFQGVLIRIKRGGAGGSFTVRRIAYGVGVERTFLFNSPLVDKVEIIRHGKVRRAKLYYLRGRSGKAARLKEKRLAKEELPPPAKLEAAPPQTAPELVPEESAEQTSQESVPPEQGERKP